MKCWLFCQTKAFQVDYFLRKREKNLKSNGVLLVARMLKSKFSILSAYLIAYNYNFDEHSSSFGMKFSVFCI